VEQSEESYKSARTIFRAMLVYEKQLSSERAVQGKMTGLPAKVAGSLSDEIRKAAVALDFDC